ncbi:hypothetical protein RAS12_27730 [Achromobacter seleniivolatilans]|uniref:Uncharacterized protein n=1 Tax=Achromobacter seleniivolatilans TaxID=3047478 RepID=A0ABY9M2C8_9BURK|nr:protealysin inhibitor emfourin [Achromobacter sp. R39]WMD20353.1 hypothetical protein RAS12_27730 [Achromobacter sp. R39]
MTTPPAWDLAQLVRLSREGGLAYLPGLAKTRSIDLVSCPPGVRKEVCDALQRAALAVPECGASGGDQRYFHVEVEFEGSDTGAAFSFDVPEADTPDMLVRLWKSGTPD